MPRSDFARLLVAMRDQADWSQTELAAHLGVSNSAVSDWEGGRQSPRDATLKRIGARMTGVIPAGCLLEPERAAERGRDRRLKARWFLVGAATTASIVAIAGIITGVLI